jgi:hypothetical protein
MDCSRKSSRKSRIAKDDSNGHHRRFPPRCMPRPRLRPRRRSLPNRSPPGHTPLVERKRKLQRLITAAKKKCPSLLYARHIDARAKDLFRLVCKSNCEGVVAKRHSGIYGIRERWFKIRNRRHSQVEGRCEPIRFVQVKDTAIATDETKRGQAHLCLVSRRPAHFFWLTVRPPEPTGNVPNRSNDHH